MTLIVLVFVVALVLDSLDMADTGANFDAAPLGVPFA
jgi:hypothetical protein